MALTKFEYNSFDVTPVASNAFAFNSTPNGLTTAAAGAMNLISTSTISSGVSTVSIASGIDSTYDTYLFKYINIHPASNDVFFQVNFRDGSTAYDATKTTTSFFAYHNEAGNDQSLAYKTSADLANGTGVQQLSFDSVGNGNDESSCGELFLFNPSSTTFVKHFIARTHGYSDDDRAYSNFSAGYFNTTSAIDAIQFANASGNMDAGDICLYGIL